MILLALGVVSDIIPVFSRKPIFGYPFMVFSGIAIGFMGWGVWAHHMFASGVGPISVAAFSVSTTSIPPPTRPNPNTRKLEYMDLAAVKECTDNRFLPDQYKAMSLDYIDQRMSELRPYV